jgi:hypothetical protein
MPPGLTELLRGIEPDEVVGAVHGTQLDAGIGRSFVLLVHPPKRSARGYASVVAYRHTQVGWVLILILGGITALLAVLARSSGGPASIALDAAIRNSAAGES